MARRSGFIEDVADMAVMLSQMHWGVGLAFTLVSAFSFFVLFPSFLPQPQAIPNPMINPISTPITSMLLLLIKGIGLLVTCSFGIATLISVFRRKA